MGSAKRLHWENVELATPDVRFTDEGSYGRVGLTEGYALANQIVGEISRHHDAGHRTAHAVGVESERGERPCNCGQEKEQGVNGVEQRPFVLLQVLVVAAWQTFDGREHCDEVAEQTSPGSTGQFERVRIPLLRHHRRAGRKRITVPHKAELTGPKQNEILAEARQVQGEHRQREQRVGDEITVGHRIDAVLRDRVEPELFLQ